MLLCVSLCLSMHLKGWNFRSTFFKKYLHIRGFTAVQNILSGFQHLQNLILIFQHVFQPRRQEAYSSCNPYQFDECPLYLTTHFCLWNRGYRKQGKRFIFKHYLQHLLLSLYLLKLTFWLLNTEHIFLSRKPSPNPLTTLRKENLSRFS